MDCSQISELFLVSVNPSLVCGPIAVPAVEVYLGGGAAPAAAGTVYSPHDGLLHRPFTRLRSQAPPHRRTGRLRTGRPGGLLYSKYLVHI